MAGAEGGQPQCERRAVDLRIEPQHEQQVGEVRQRVEGELKRRPLSRRERLVPNDGQLVQLGETAEAGPALRLDLTQMQPCEGGQSQQCIENRRVECVVAE